MALSDIEIARQANKKPIKEVAKTLNLDEDSLHTFGKFTAKITSKTFNGKSRVEQHKMVYKALKGKMGNELHALALTTEEKNG